MKLVDFENPQIIKAERSIKEMYYGNTANALTLFEKEFVNKTLHIIAKGRIRSIEDLYDHLCTVGTISNTQPNRIYWSLVRHCKLQLSLISCPTGNKGMSFSSIKNFLIKRNSIDFKSLKKKNNGN